MHLAIIGNGIVGTACSAWLQRDGQPHHLHRSDRTGRGHVVRECRLAAPSGCFPVAMPGMWKKIPGWLLDPLGPLTIRWSYAPVVAP
jgi:D-amino-acid dehydrogenase